MFATLRPCGGIHPLVLTVGGGYGGRGFFPTLSEVAQEAEYIVVAERVNDVGIARFRIDHVVRGDDSVAVGDEFATAATYKPKKGKYYVLHGAVQDKRRWEQLRGSFSSAAIEYVAELPPPDTPRTELLKHLAPYLGSGDSTIAGHVAMQFQTARWQDVAAISKSLPREKLRERLANTDFEAQDHTNLYGRLLGLCGDESDEELLKATSLQKADEYRFGIEGVMMGYILLAGEDGLALIEDAKLKPGYVVRVAPNGKIQRENKVPFSETYAAVEAVRFMWTHGDGKIGEERLRKSMRLLLDRRDLADLVVSDLTRWKDWSVQNRVVAMFDAAEYDVRPIKLAIVRYFLVCIRDVPPGAKREPAHVTKAKAYLTTLRKLDPKLVAEAERAFD